MLLIQYTIILAPIVLLAIFFAIILHECAHGVMAKWNGDLTAKFSKRITLNPVRHFDILGFIMLIFVGFGFAKPVPVNIENFRNKRKGVILVSIAGVATNLILAIFSALFLVIIERFAPIGAFAIRGGLGNYIAMPAYSYFLWWNPDAFSVPSIAGAGEAVALVFGLFFFISLQINVALMLFNLLPLFPLDGHRLLEAGLGSFNRVVKFLRDWGPAILLALVGISILFGIINPFVNVRLNLFSPLGALMHFGGGGITQALMNFFRAMFGLPTVWVF